MTAKCRRAGDGDQGQHGSERAEAQLPSALEGPDGTYMRLTRKEQKLNPGLCFSTQLMCPLEICTHSFSDNHFLLSCPAEEGSSENANAG